MPRLLLVDDNPSIHKIAETLLAHTPIELVCVDSGKAALDRVEHGERFDVALIDTAMLPMDGWELLNRLRSHPATTQIPIAMMAGVLDQVDPSRLESAPIQGFLKKPVELRELGDRVQKLIDTPVQAMATPPTPAPDLPMASPFSTVPSVKLSDLPELRSQPEPIAEAEAEPEGETLPGVEIDVLDLLEEDLWPEPEAKKIPRGPEMVLPPRPGTVTEELDALSEITEEPVLELEDFDLDSLKGLSLAPPSVEVVQPVEMPPPIALPSALSEATPTEEPSAVLPDLGSQQESAFVSEPLGSLEPLPVEAPVELAKEEVSFETAPPFTFDWKDESEDLLAGLPPLAASAPTTPPFDLPETTFEAPANPLVTAAIPFQAEPTPTVAPEILPEASREGIEETPKPEPIAEPTPHAVPIVASATPSPDLRALVDAMVADPALVDLLARAVVSRLGDQTMREMAWEIMPDLAERLRPLP